jgi:protein tyrosine phosphatase
VLTPIGKYQINSVTLTDKVIAGLKQHAQAFAEYNAEYRRRANTTQKQLFELTPEVYTLMQATDRQAAGARPKESVIKLAEHYRHRNVPALAGHYRYNANTLLPGVYVGEGPKNQQSLGWMFGMLFDAQNPIATIIAIGAAIEERKGRTISKYFPYFSEEVGTCDDDKGHKKYTWKIVRNEATLCDKQTIDDVSTDIVCYMLHVIQSDIDGRQQEKNITLYHFPHWRDHCAFEMQEDARTCVTKLFTAAPQHPIFIHCSAGVGRSGTLAFPFYCQATWLHPTKVKAIVKLSSAAQNTENDMERAIAEKIIEKLITVRDEIRPGLIRSKDQLQQALCETMLLLQKSYAENPDVFVEQEVSLGIRIVPSVNLGDQSGSATTRFFNPYSPPPPSVECLSHSIDEMKLTLPTSSKRGRAHGQGTEDINKRKKRCSLLFEEEKRTEEGMIQRSTEETAGSVVFTSKIRVNEND